MVIKSASRVPHSYILWPLKSRLNFCFQSWHYGQKSDPHPTLAILTCRQPLPRNFWSDYYRSLPVFFTWWRQKICSRLAVNTFTIPFFLFVVFSILVVFAFSSHFATVLVNFSHGLHHSFCYFMFCLLSSRYWKNDFLNIKKKKILDCAFFIM